MKRYITILTLLFLVGVCSDGISAVNGTQYIVQEKECYHPVWWDFYSTTHTFNQEEFRQYKQAIISHTKDIRYIQLPAGQNYNENVEYSWIDLEACDRVNTAYRQVN